MFGSGFERKNVLVIVPVVPVVKFPSRFKFPATTNDESVVAQRKPTRNSYRTCVKRATLTLVLYANAKHALR